MKITRCAGLTALAALVLTCRAGAWGRTGHDYVNGAAVGTLPAGTTLATFFAANKDYLVAHSSDPDVWRDKQRVPGEGPHHFIDMDAYGTPSAFALTNLPAKRQDADKKFGHDFVETMGTVDWTIDLWTQRLADAMKKGDTDTILADAAILGHYVGDAHVPFHSALNYDGQMSAQKGIHSRFEEQMVHDTIKPSDLTPQPAEALPDVVAAARVWSGQSLDLTPTILTADIQARALADTDTTAPKNPIPTTGPLPPTFDRYTNKPLIADGSPPRDYYSANPTYWAAFDTVCRPIALARLNAAATHLGSTWLTAWTLAGKPDLSKLKAPTANVPVPAPDPDAK